MGRVRMEWWSFIHSWWEQHLERADGSWLCPGSVPVTRIPHPQLSQQPQ